jgi:prolyl-tRNA editing enzyme YbaK/EbsC (Cys-tRNA(Pro) deacylase)
MGSSVRRDRYDPALMRIAGTLDWQPAAEHPELLAPSVAAAVSALQLDCRVAPIDSGLADTAAFCATYDVPPEISANCVVVAGRRGEISTMAACLVLATHRADVNKTVRKHLDVRKISFASMEEAVARTGMEYGGITPVGLPDGWPILVDSAAIEPEWVVVGSGIRGSKIILPGRTLARLPYAEVLELAQRGPSG